MRPTRPLNFLKKNEPYTAPSVNHNNSAEPRSTGRYEKSTKVDNLQGRLMELFEQTANEQNAERFMKLVARKESYGA